MNRVVKSLILIVTVFVFFFWATFGNIFLPLALFFPTFHVFFILFAALFAFLFKKYDLSVIDLSFGRSPFFVLPAAALSFLSLSHFCFFRAFRTSRTA